ncbi:MAG: fimbria/pilus outer membrane usher protein [Candidatus Delongbacteria bacterium]|nr:fimbria/pilus outer membrane usher protein [Candidatus Delongbacteria bacterium]
MLNILSRISRYPVIAVLIVLPGLLFSQNHVERAEANGTDYDALFLKVFGYEKPKPTQLLVPFYLGKRSFGKIELFRTENNGGFYMRKKDLVSYIGRYVDLQKVEDAFNEVNDSDIIHLTELKEKGFEAVFDEDILYFQLAIPPEFRKRNSSNFGLNRVPESINYATRPNSFSSFVNIRASEEFFYNNNYPVNDLRRPFISNFDGAVNFKNFVIEGSADYNETTQWQRGGVRVVYDRPDQMIRYYAGDITYPTDGFRTSVPIGGFGFSKDFNLQPYFTIKPVSNTEVMILRRSTVEIYNNNILVNRSEVEPGPFNFKQASIGRGLSNVTVKITDDLGEENVIVLDDYYNHQQLETGLSQYSFNFGFESKRVGRTYEYNKEKPVLSFFYRIGLNKMLTASFNSQLKKDRYLFGIGNIFGTKFGSFNVDYAVNTAGFSKFDYAAGTTYSYFNNDHVKNPYGRQWCASFDYKTGNFGYLNDLQSGNNDEFLFSGSVGQRVVENLSASISGSYNIGKDSYLYSLGTGYRFFRALNVSCRLIYDNLYGDNEWKGYIGFYYSLDPNNNFSTSYNTTNPDRSINWSYRPSDYNFDNSLSVGNSEDTRISISDRVSYSGNRGSVSIGHEYNENYDNNFTHTTSMNIRTGVAFVDGVFGLSRPVSNSFAIIRPDSLLRKYTAGINKTMSGSFQYQSGILGPAVFSSLSPYIVKDFYIHLPDLPIGYVVTGTDQVLLPSYKSGFLIDIKAEDFVFVKGRLVDENGEPVIRKVIKIKSCDNSSMETKTAFTNNGGYFYISEMKKGNYKLSFGDDESININFVVADESDKIYCNLGNLVINDQELAQNK